MAYRHSLFAMLDEGLDAVASVGDVCLPSKSHNHSRQHCTLTTCKTTVPTQVRTTGFPTHHTTPHHTTPHHTTPHHTTPHHPTTQPNPTQHNTTQHNTTQHNTTQHNTTQHNTTQHNTTQHSVQLTWHLMPITCL